MGLEMDLLPSTSIKKAGFALQHVASRCSNLLIFSLSREVCTVGRLIDLLEIHID